MTLETIIEILEDELFLLIDSPDHDLIDTGELDSLRFVELLLAVEQRTGQKLTVGDLNLDDLRTPRRMTKAFGELLASSEVTNG